METTPVEEVADNIIIEPFAPPPPAPPPLPPAQKECHVYASFMRRWLAYILDNLLINVFTFVVAALAYARNSDMMEDGQFGEFFWLVCAFNAVAVIGYFTLAIGGDGRTIGKRLMGIRVISEDGGEVTYSRAFIRCIGYYISAFFLYIGFLLALIDTQNQTFHDKIAGTIVVED